MSCTGILVFGVFLPTAGATVAVLRGGWFGGVAGIMLGSASATPSSRALGVQNGRPAGHRHGRLRLAARRPAGPATRRAERRGGPGLGAAGHDLGARPAWRPAAASARPRVPAVAAPLQRPRGGRPVPVAADARSLRRCPVRTPAWTAAVDSGRLQRPVPQPTRRPLRGHLQPSGRHRQVAAVPEPHRTPWQCPQAAGAHCRSLRACTDGRPPEGAVCSPSAGAVAPPPRVDSGRPASTRPHA
jgi:hypothetical protein